MDRWTRPRRGDRRRHRRAWSPPWSWRPGRARSPCSSAPTPRAARCARSRSAARDRRRADRVHHALGLRRDLRRGWRQLARRAPAPAAGRHPGAPRLERAASGSTSSPTSTARPTRSRRFAGRRGGAPLPRVLRRARGASTGRCERPFIRAPRPSPLVARASASGCAASATSGASGRSRRCGGRSASTSTIRGCASCSAATRPIAARRRSRRRRR